MIQPTHAEYTDGSIRKLEKDCGCFTHDGPHWLHMDGVSNEIYTERGDIAGQIARLDRKLFQMNSQGIVRLLTAQHVEGENI